MLSKLNEVGYIAQAESATTWASVKANQHGPRSHPPTAGKMGTGGGRLEQLSEGQCLAGALEMILGVEGWWCLVLRPMCVIPTAYTHP